MRAQLWPVISRAAVALLAAGGLAVLPTSAAAEGQVFCVPAVIADAGCNELQPTLQAGYDRASTVPGADTVRLAAGTHTGKLRAWASVAPEQLTTITGAGQGATILTGAAGGLPTVDIGGSVTVTDLSIRDTDLSRSSLSLIGGRVERVTVENTGTGTAQLVLSQSGGELVDLTVHHAGVNEALNLNSSTALRARVTSTGGAGALVRMDASRLINSSVAMTVPSLYTDSYGIGVGSIDNLISGSTVTLASPRGTAVSLTTSGANAALVIRDSSLAQLAPGSTAPALHAGASSNTASLVASGIAARGFSGLACAATGASAAATANVNVSHAVAPSTAVARCPTDALTPNAGTETFTTGAGVTLTDPGFIDAAGGNFGTAQSSPVVDAGSAAAPPPGLPDVDLYGNPRRSDGNGDGVAQLDIGASEWTPAPVVPGPADSGGPGAGGGGGTPPGPPVSILPIPTVTFSALRRQGNVTRVSTKGKAAFKLLAKKPKKLKRGTALITTTVSLAGVRFTATLERRRPKQGKRKAKYVAVKGTETIAVAKRILRLQPTGRWRGKPLKTGRYRLKLTSPSGFTRRTTFSVVPRKR